MQGVCESKAIPDRSIPGRARRKQSRDALTAGMIGKAVAQYPNFIPRGHSCPPEAKWMSDERNSNWSSQARIYR